LPAPLCSSRVPDLCPYPLFPYTTLFRSLDSFRWGFTARPVLRHLGGPFSCRLLLGEVGVHCAALDDVRAARAGKFLCFQVAAGEDRKSTRLNSSHVSSSYAVFGLEKKKP